MLPLPYGLIPHELVEIIDNERLLPGISKIFKLAEDLPYIDHHSIKKEADKISIFHLRAYVFFDFGDDKNNLMI